MQTGFYPSQCLSLNTVQSPNSVACRCLVRALYPHSRPLLATREYSKSNPLSDANAAKSKDIPHLMQAILETLLALLGERVSFFSETKVVYKVCSKSSKTFSEKRQQIIIFAKFIYWLQNSPLPSQYRVQRVEKAYQMTFLGRWPESSSKSRSSAFGCAQRPYNAFLSSPNAIYRISRSHREPDQVNMASD